MKITANAVTLVRMALVPVPAAMLMTGDSRLVWVGFFLGAILGATDAVDGHMARRDGPTVLGALLDPLADKLFTAAFFLPIIALGHVPAWVIAAIFARELLITALRSSMELHSARLKTSQLGKLKTVVQMGGLAVYVFLMFSPEGWGTWLHVAGILGLVVTGALFKATGRKLPYWVVAAVPMWGGVFSLSLFLPPLDTVFWLFILIMVLTWVSGFDYLGGSWQAYRQRGLTRADVARVLWGLANGALPVLAAGIDEGLVIPVMVGLGANLAIGGIDNVVTAEEKRAMRGGFTLTAISAAAVLAAAAWTVYAGGPSLAPLVAAGAYVLVSLICAGAAFVKNRGLFLPRPAPKEGA